jgi:hypothetical protein
LRLLVLIVLLSVPTVLAVSGEELAGAYHCMTITRDGETTACDTRTPMLIREDGTYAWADNTGSWYTGPDGIVFLRDPPARGQTEMAAGPATWGPGHPRDSGLVFLQEDGREVAWERVTEQKYVVPPTVPGVALPLVALALLGAAFTKGRRS